MDLSKSLEGLISSAGDLIQSLLPLPASDGVLPALSPEGGPRSSPDDLLRAFTKDGVFKSLFPDGLLSSLPDRIREYAAYVVRDRDAALLVLAYLALSVVAVRSGKLEMRGVSLIARTLAVIIGAMMAYDVWHGGLWDILGAVRMGSLLVTLALAVPALLGRPSKRGVWR